MESEKQLQQIGDLYARVSHALIDLDVKCWGWNLCEAGAEAAVRAKKAEAIAEAARVFCELEDADQPISEFMKLREAVTKWKGDKCPTWV